MATTVPFAARLAVPPAGNADLNPTSDPAIDILITSVDPDSPDPSNPDIGDLKLENFATDGQLDDDTWISIDGGASWQSFDVLFHGTVVHNNLGLYDKTSSGGPNFVNVELVSLRLEDGTELFFFPGESYNTADMDYFPTGAVDIDYTVGTEPPAICFVRGTLIATGVENVAVEELRIGDIVITRDNGPQAISWIGKRKMSGHFAQHFMPIRINANALSDGLPKRDLLVSPQHRILVTDWHAELMFGASEVLVAAKHLVNDTDIRVATDLEEFEYYHILFESHQTVFSEGLPTESFHPGDMAIKSLSEDSRAEVLDLFPELANDVASYGPATHRSLKAYEAKALQSA